MQVYLNDDEIVVSHDTFTLEVGYSAKQCAKGLTGNSKCPAYSGASARGHARLQVAQKDIPQAVPVGGNEIAGRALKDGVPPIGTNGTRIGQAFGVAGPPRIKG